MGIGFLNLLESREYLGWCIGCVKERNEEKKISECSLGWMVESVDYLAREVMLYS